MNELQRDYSFPQNVEWKKPDTTKYILYNSIYIMFIKNSFVRSCVIRDKLYKQNKK